LDHTMPTSVPYFRPHAALPTSKQQYDDRRGDARQRGYTGAWKRAAVAYRLAHPLCEYCRLEGRTTPAGCVDHLYPHKGDKKLFWRSEWWVSSCYTCHNSLKQAVERQGKAALDILARRLGRPVMASAGA
jgi:5-methylcytosine-specific restriction endonuclease McrA